MRVRADRCGSLRVGDSAAQLNSMLAFPKLHLKIDAPPMGQSIDWEKTWLTPARTWFWPNYGRIECVFADQVAVRFTFAGH